MSEKSVILSSKFIPFDDNYEFFYDYERGLNLSPVSNYFFIVHDLSINLHINLKWLYWGYNFFKLLDENIDNLEEFDRFDKITEDSIQGCIDLKNEKKERKLYFDGMLVKDVNDLNNIIKEYYLLDIFDENTIISVKLKLNFDEYFIISNVCYPQLGTFTIVTNK